MHQGTNPPPAVDGFEEPTEAEAMELIVPLVIRLRLFFCAQANGYLYTSPLIEVMLGEIIFRLCDDISSTLGNWLPYHGAKDAHWGKKLNMLVHMKDEKTINLFLKGIDDKRMRTLLRMGWACHQLGFVEDMVQDGEPINKFITGKVYRKLDDALHGFLYNWANDNNFWGPAVTHHADFSPPDDNDQADATANGVPTS